MTEVNVQKKNLYDHPIFSEESKQSVKKKWKEGVYSNDDARLYKAGFNVKELGFFNLEKDDVKTLWKQGYIPREMATEYKAFHERSEKPSSWSGSYMLQQLAQGRSIEDVNKDLGGIEHLWYDPIDLFIDVATGGLSFGARRVGKWSIEGIKAGITKAGVKEMAKSAGLGTVAGAGMTLADELGGGTISTLLAGLVTPMGVHALATMGRQSFISLFTRMRKGNPKLAYELKTTIQSSKAKSIAHLRAALGELDEAEIGTTKMADFSEGLSMPKEKIVEPGASQGAKKVSKGMEFAGKVKGQEIGTKPLTQEAAQAILKKIKTGADTEGEVLKQLGEGRGTDLAAAIHEIHKPTIEKARGGHVPRKVTEAEAEKYIKNEYTKFADITGKRVIDVEKALGDVKVLQEDFQNVSAKVTAFNDLYATIMKEVEPMLAKSDLTFVEEIKLAEKIMGIAEFTEAIYGIRAEFGRGLGMYNRMFRKLPYTLDNIPQHEFEMLEAASRPQIRKYLKAFRKADGLRGKINVAKNTEKYRFLKGALELMQGSLLWHVGTQGVNILGNTLAYGTETLGRYAGVSYDAWKIAGALKKPLSFDGYRMREIYYDIMSHKYAWEALFKNPKGVSTAIKKSLAGGKETTFKTFAKELDTEEVGSFWKALLTGEAQIDPFYKFEGQESQAIEGLGLLWNSKNKTIKIPDVLMKPIGGFFRIPFKGLTAMDEFYKTFAVNQKMSSELFRQGLKDGVIDIKKHVSTGMKNIDLTDPMYLKAIKQGRKATYTDDLGDTTKQLEKLMSTGRFGLITKIMALPFFKILVNLNKYALKNTPLGFIAKDIREIMSNGTTADKAEVIAKMVMGTTALGVGATLYEQGKITGRTPRSQYSAWGNAKKQSYSFISEDEKTGDQTFTDYGRLDPYAVLIGVGADLALAVEMTNDLYMDEKTTDEFNEAFQDTIIAFGAAFTEPFLNKTFTKSANEAVTFITNPERTNIPKFAERQLGKFYPRCIDMFNQATGRDEILREIRNPLDGWFARFDPEKLPPKRHNVYGTIQKRDSRAFFIMNQKISSDSVMDEMMKLGMNVGPMGEKMTLAGKTKKLTPEQYDKLTTELTKIDIKAMLQEVINDPQYKESGDSAFKASLLNSIIRDTRAIAKAEFMASEFGLPISKQLIRELIVTEAAMMGKLQRPHKVGRFYKFLKERQ